MNAIHFADPNPSGSPPVLLLHGLGASGDSWGLQMPALIQAGYRPVAPDLPGFGASPYDGRGWNIERTVADVTAWLQQIGTGPAHVVGLSMGGVVAQLLAGTSPELIHRLILVSTFAHLRPEKLTGWVYFSARALAVMLLGLPFQARLVAGRIFPGADQGELRKLMVASILQSDPRAYRWAMLALGRFDSRPWLHTLRIPTLVVSGELDSTISPARQRLLAGLIPGASQVVIPRANHAVPVERPEEFNRVLLQFIH
jgi:pimeloyl-ACP methyl ester carboxylesterase